MLNQNKVNIQRKKYVYMNYFSNIITIYMDTRVPAFDKITHATTEVHIQPH
jgi:hypothetical protein